MLFLQLIDLLGTRHVGRCPSSRLGAKVFEKYEMLEVLDEDCFLLEKLGDIDAEFAREFQSPNESVVDFPRGHHTRRMEEVAKEIHVSPGDNYKRGLLPDGAVLAEPQIE